MSDEQTIAFEQLHSDIKNLTKSLNDKLTALPELIGKQIPEAKELKHLSVTVDNPVEPKDKIEVTNQLEAKILNLKELNQKFDEVIEAFKSNNEVTVKNSLEVNSKEINDLLKKLVEKDTTVEAPKVKVNVDSVKVTNLPTRANEPLAVRLSDGKNFITQLVASMGGGGGASRDANNPNYVSVVNEISSTSALVLSEVNSRNTVVAPSSTWTSGGELNSYSDFMIAVETDQIGTYTVQVSQDGTNYITIGSYSYRADGTDRPHVFVKGVRYLRVSFTNSSGNAQTYFRFQTYYGDIKSLNVPTNGVIVPDADAIVARTIGEQITLAENKFAGYSLVSKLGKNSDIDTTSTPEDLWEGGGTYTGFPTTEEEIQVLSSSASDTGTLYFLYLENANSTEYQLGSATLNGTTPVNTGINGLQVHTVWYDSGGSGFNVGTITIRQRTTTANVFITMVAGQSQSNAAVYRVPAGHTGYLTNINGQIRGGNNSYLDGSIYYKELGKSPRLRQPFSINLQNGLDRTIKRFPLPEGTCLTMRFQTAGANNIAVVGGLEIRVVKD